MRNGIESILNGLGHSLTIKSAFRSPLVQQAVDLKNIQAGKYTNPSPHSRHLHGDAVDIATFNNPPTWQTLHDIARKLYPGACIKPSAKSTYEPYPHRLASALCGSALAEIKTSVF